MRRMCRAPASLLTGLGSLTNVPRHCSLGRSGPPAVRNAKDAKISWHGGSDGAEALRDRTGRKGQRNPFGSVDCRVYGDRVRHCNNNVSAARRGSQIRANRDLMQISVTGQQIDIGDALRDHIEESLEATVAKYFGDAIEANVVISRERQMFRADIAVHVFRGLHVRGHDTADDAYAAFDIAVAHIGKRLRRHKRRLRDHHTNPPAGERLEAQQYVLAGYEGGSDAGDDAATGDNPVIIAEDTTHIEELSVSQAVMRLDIADLPALMFRNAGSGSLNVVYRRADGNVGWIDPTNG